MCVSLKRLSLFYFAKDQSCIIMQQRTLPVFDREIMSHYCYVIVF